MATETTRPMAATLVSVGTQNLINARDAHRYTLTQDRVQWRIARPPFVHDAGVCFLLVARMEDGCTVAIGRKGDCADVYDEARVTGIAEGDVDATVRRLWTTGR